MQQRDLAKQLGLSVAGLCNWECNSTKPEIRYMPAIIDFLGYNPVAPATSIGEQLVQRRSAHGLTQRSAAERLGVDPGTLAKWERGEKRPLGPFLVRVERFLDTAKSVEPDVTRVV